MQLLPGYCASNRLGRHAEFYSERRHGVDGMRSRAVDSPILQMRQQAPGEDGEVLIAKSLEQQRRQRLRCA